MNFASTLGTMELYFGSHHRADPDSTNKSKVVAFEIPDLGIGFKAPFEGGEDQTDYASLLALLEFVDLNRKLFGDKSLRILGGNLRVVEQVNAGQSDMADIQPLLDRTLEYREKYRFSLEWTPSESNPAAPSDQ